MIRANTDESVEAFFSDPNIIWPRMAPDHPAAGGISPFLRALESRGECPLILPRRDALATASTVYVVCWDHSHAGRTRPLLQAAVADYLSPFDGRVAPLREADAPERAILDMVGPGTTFVLRPTQQTEARLVLALQRLARTLSGRPLRNPVLPRPVGRMLREFDLALATGATEQSAALLQEIERAGGISHENVAFLQIQRLGRLGRDRELLSHGSLPTVVHTEPPQAVRDIVLGAWGRVNLYADSELDLDLGSERLAREPIDIAMLVGEGLAQCEDPDAVSLGVLVAVARGDLELARKLLENWTLPVQVRDLLDDRVPSPNAPPIETLIEHDADKTGVSDVSSVAVKDQPDESSVADGERSSDSDPVAGSWFEWLAQLGGPLVGPPANELVETWDPAWQVDRELGRRVDALPDFATDSLLAGVTAFLETADPSRPAPHTARSFASRYLVEERFGPADLGALTALMAIFLSSSPSPGEYTSLLEDFATFAPQWASIAASAQTLDLADVVACGPRTAPEAQAQFLSAVLGPLHGQRHRLSGGLRSLAALITDDSGLSWDWTIPTGAAGTAERELPDGINVLIYSLDAGASSRVATSLADQYPTMNVHQASDKVGTPALRQHSRNADIIVIATRRAAHAATGFIIDNAVRGRVCYPDGSGSASMLRAVEAGLEAFVGAAN